MKSLKYLSPISFYSISIYSFFITGFGCWVPLLYAFVIVPLLELVLNNTDGNMSQVEEDLAKTNRWYDFMVYLIVPFQFVALWFFLKSFEAENLSNFDIAGHISAMGLLCGIFGINVGHELGHRTNVWEQRMAKVLLLSSLYMHFFIEHNKGHHKNVATINDPASSRLNEPIYFFYFRSIYYSYLSAWNIANKEAAKKGFSIISFKNEMFQTQIIQAIFVMLIAIVFGKMITLWFILAAFNGALLLETVNYIEHYGLQRNKLPSGNYERTLPQHSWNSNHVIGRMLLFELSRHSDHHYMASRKYQILRTYDTAPQLPTGYPGSMILSLFPPLWFKIMNKRVKLLKTQLS
jgi:alkane 1-monooxygenase